MKHKHRVKLEIPPKDVVTVTIGGYKFFRGADANQLQCATCLCLMGMEVIGKMINGQVRRCKVIKDCDCPPQKGRVKNTLKLTEVEVEKKVKPITHMMKMGGYWYVNRHFPFIHFEKEYLVLGNETKIYRWEKI